MFLWNSLFVLDIVYAFVFIWKYAILLCNCFYVCMHILCGSDNIHFYNIYVILLFCVFCLFFIVFPLLCVFFYVSFCVCVYFVSVCVCFHLYVRFCLSVFLSACVLVCDTLDVLKYLFICFFPWLNICYISVYVCVIVLSFLFFCGFFVDTYTFFSR